MLLCDWEFRGLRLAVHSELTFLNYGRAVKHSRGLVDSCDKILFSNVQGKMIIGA